MRRDRAPNIGPDHRPSPWVRIAARTAVVALGIAALTQNGAPASASHSPRAHGAARTLKLRDEGSLHLVKRSGSVLLGEGPASGTLPGKVRVRFLYNGSPIVTAQFTIRTTSGSIRGHGLSRLSSPRSSSPSFVGPLAITGGSGRYARARGRGKLYGVFYPRSGKLIFQPVGQLRY
jgi:hypothetical protein